MVAGLSVNGQKGRVFVISQDLPGLWWGQVATVFSLQFQSGFPWAAIAVAPPKLAPGPFQILLRALFSQSIVLVTSVFFSFLKCLWLTPVILATQEVEIRRTAVRSQPRQIVCETLPQKKPITKKGWSSGFMV
jgi:hypothetical protein